MHHAPSKMDDSKGGVSRETPVRRVNVSFTNTEVAKDLVEHVLDIDAADQSAELGCRVPQLLGDQLLTRARRRGFRQSTLQGRNRLRKQMTMARAGYNRGFAARKVLFDEVGQRTIERVDP